MKKIVGVFLICFSSLVCAAKNNYLFFQTCQHGSIAKLHKNNYIVTLNHPEEEINYFTGFAKAQKGSLSLTKFIALWNNKKIKQNFIKNPPNAIISMTLEMGKKEIIVATVSNPGFANGAVTYQISVLNDKVLQEGKFKQVALYFDDILLNSNELKNLEY